MSIIEKPSRKEKIHTSPGPPNDTESTAIPRAMVKQLIPILRTLPPKDAHALIHHYLLDRPYKDIATEEGVDNITIHLRIQRALTKIRTALGITQTKR